MIWIKGLLLAVFVAASAASGGLTYRAQDASGDMPLDIEGDAITRIAMSSPDASHAVVAGDNGLYVTDNSGEWERLTDAPPPGQLVFAAGNPDLMLVGDHPPCLRGGEQTTLQRSMDGGQSWEPIEQGEGLKPLAIWTEPQLALASSCAGLFTSRDEGQSWSSVEGIEPGFDLTAFAIVMETEESADGPTVMIGQTGEGGTSTLFTIDFSDLDAPEISEPLRMYFASSGLAGVDDMLYLAGPDGVWISEDGGETWIESSEGLDEVTLDEDPLEVFPTNLEPNSFGFYSAAVNPAAPEMLMLGSVDGIYVRSSADAPWTMLDGTSGRIDQVQVMPGGERVLYVSEEQVYEADLPAAEAGTRAGEHVAAQEVTVTILDFEFAQQEVTVPVGTTVTWVNEGPTIHNTVSEDELWQSDIMQAGDTFSYTFETPGEFAYLCTFHPAMTAVIIVTE